MHAAPCQQARGASGCQLRPSGPPALRASRASEIARGANDARSAEDAYDQLGNPLVTHGSPEETTTPFGAPPGGRARFVFREGEAARTPERFRSRVLAQFRSPENLGYLRGLFAATAPAGKLRAFAVETAEDAALAFSCTQDRALDVLASDPLARRGYARRAGDFWAELRRLNRAFYDSRMRGLALDAATIDPQARRDGVADASEDYAFSMFTADSLRPPGLERLNAPGPSWALREDQSTWEPAELARSGRAGPAPADRRRPPCQTRAPRFAPDRPGREGFAGTPAQMAQVVRRAGGGLPVAWGTLTAARYPQDDVSVAQLGAGARRAPGGEGEEDAWDDGNPNRSAEEALAEYYGDGQVESRTQLGAKEQVGRSYGSLFAWGDAWQENGGSRLMRYESIPFWRKGGHEGYDYDIEEDLGTQMRETGNPVRRWPMDRMRRAAGQEYRTLGPRS